MAKNVLKSPERALETGANVGSAFASRSPKAAFSSSRGDQLLSQRKRIILGQICIIYAI